MATIDNFIAKSQEMAARSSSCDDTTSAPDEWDTVAPGVDTSDFQPKDIPLPPPPPAIVGPGVDTGRIPNPFLVTTRKDIEDFFAEPGICGLVNLGNTCYMNAGLQCLRSIPCIAQYYWKNDNFITSEKEQVIKGEEQNQGNENLEKQEERQTTEETEEKEEDSHKEESEKSTPDMKTVIRGHISARLTALIRKIWAGQFSAVIPQTFKTTLGLLYPQFGGYRQQDCQEFLVILLDCLHEDICHYRNTILDTINDSKQDNDRQSMSIITDTFQGQLKNEVTCSVCGHSSVKYDPFVYLSVPIPHSNERQITVYWSSIGNDSLRTVTKLLVVVPILCTVNDLKIALCLLLKGSVKPDNIVIAHIKNHTIISTLANTLAIKLVNDNEYQVFAFHIESTQSETTPIAETTPTSIDTPSNNTTDGYELLSSEPDSMETDSTPTDPWQPVANDEGLPAKVPRNEETTPLLEEEGEAEPKVVVMEWHMCVICLEEMIDSDLLTHTACGATICDTCLEASRRHSTGNDDTTTHMPCPVCQTMVSSVDGFVPLATGNDKSDDIVRLLQLTILFRNESEGIWKLFGHPCLKNIPASSPVNIYYQSILSLLPTQCSQHAWSLALTDGKGQYCSRCVFGSGCHGCILSNAMDDVSLKPGDFLSISFNNLPTDVIEEINNPLHHSSLETLWPNTVSLQDCLDLFSQKEVLGSDNPWWCPKCKANQIAVRQLMISHLPTTLIVHLKRFLFHGNNASKVDTGVGFPLSLPITTSQSSDVYNMSLMSCVCHFGSLNSGHYTAFSRQPVTGKWHYYNDETATESQPSQKDSESVYILFYHHESNDPVIELPTERGCTYPSEEEELVQLEPLLRILKPKPTEPSIVAAPLIKKSSSTGNLNEVSGDSDIQLQQQLAASLGLELPTVPLSSNLSPLKSSSSNPSLSTDDDGIVLKSVRFKPFDV